MEILTEAQRAVIRLTAGQVLGAGYTDQHTQ